MVRLICIVILIWESQMTFQQLAQRHRTTTKHATGAKTNAKHIPKHSSRQHHHYSQHTKNPRGPKSQAGDQRIERPTTPLTAAPPFLKSTPHPYACPTHFIPNSTHGTWGRSKFERPRYHKTPLTFHLRLHIKDETHGRPEPRI